MPKLTVYDIRQLKGKGQLAQVFVGSEEEAAAGEAALGRAPMRFTWDPVPSA